MAAIKLLMNQVPKELRHLDNYRGRKFSVEVVNEVEVPSDAGLWSGGSRELYFWVRLSDGKAIESPMQHSSPWNANRREFVTPLPEGIALVCHTMFCGKDLGLRFYVNPANAGKFLTNGKEV